MPKTNPPAPPAAGAGGTRVIRRESLPHPRSFGRGAILLWDRRLGRRVPGFAAWRRGFPAALGLQGGEGVKAMERFPPFIARLVDLAAGLSRRETRIVAAGGGSVGDLAGFAAGILKRGVDLVHLPSTWLAAVDSAHGGKNALNVGGAKNQVGLFWFPSKVYLVRELLRSGPERLAREGLGELIKAAFLAGGEWFARLERARLRGASLLWRNLAEAVRVKAALVAADPEERRGERQLLNLGHTVGHVLEAHHGWPHGQAVAQGLHFALAWSRRRAGLGGEDHGRCVSLLRNQGGFPPALDAEPRLDEASFLRLLRRDKKAAGGDRVTFVFLAAPGRPIRRSVTVDQVLAEARRQGVVGR